MRRNIHAGFLYGCLNGPLGISRPGYGDNIKMYLKVDGLASSGLIWHTPLRCFEVPQNDINFSTR